MIKNFFFLMFIVLCVFSFFKIKIITENKYINVLFDELEPVSKNIPVYLKGVRIGRVYKIILTTDVDYSVVKLEIYKKYKLPINTCAKLKYDRLGKEYITLKLPHKPYKGFLQNNASIKGSAVKNLRKVLEDHIEKGNVDTIVAQTTDGLENITEAADKINEAADLIVNIIKDNRPEIDKIIKNFAIASEDTGFMISELRDSLNDPQVRKDIKDMTKNLSETAKNINNTTSNPRINQSIDNIYQTTKNLKTSSTKVDSIICKTSKTLDSTDVAMKSIADTSEGLSDMLSKRFLFFRLMFGKPGVGLEK